jgi:hypothetical protein
VLTTSAGERRGRHVHLFGVVEQVSQAHPGARRGQRVAGGKAQAAAYQPPGALAADQTFLHEPAADHVAHLPAQVLDPAAHRPRVPVPHDLGERRVGDPLADRPRVADQHPAVLDGQPAVEQQLAEHRAGQSAVQCRPAHLRLARVLVVPDEKQLVGQRKGTHRVGPCSVGGAATLTVPRRLNPTNGGIYVLTPGPSAVRT